MKCDKNFYGTMKHQYSDTETKILAGLETAAAAAKVFVRDRSMQWVILIHLLIDKCVQFNKKFVDSVLVALDQNKRQL